MSSTVYSIFEKDSIKYLAYMKAVENTLRMIVSEQPETEKSAILIGLLGAGRGGIMISIARAIRNFFS